jgi:hypothetical protein
MDGAMYARRSGQKTSAALHSDVGCTVWWREKTGWRRTIAVAGVANDRVGIRKEFKKNQEKKPPGKERTDGSVVV